MKGTMQDFPLCLPALFRHGVTLHGSVEVVTLDGDRVHRSTYADVAGRARRLAGALTGLGVGAGDRVATFLWNNRAHLEAYLAVPAMGAVLHTLNIRLFPEQVAYVANHAEDKVVLTEASLLDRLADVLPKLTTVRQVVVVDLGEEAAETAGNWDTLDYEKLVAGAGELDWPDVDERAAAAMCYTSGTTGRPKGVVYSHRSVYLHSMANCMASGFGLSEADRLLVVVPMFHANGWGFPYAAWMAGAAVILPNRFLQPEPLARLIHAERPTVSGGVPTVWQGVLDYAEANGLDLSSLRVVSCAGSAVPPALMRAYDRHGVTLLQAWGMTETSPLAAIARPPATCSQGEEQWRWRTKTGRPVPGVEVRLVDENDQVLPSDGKAVGEFEVRGPWVAGSYYRDPDTSRFHDGWLRTGDLGTLDPLGFMQITDRVKDVIKSGGEWISSVQLENELMAHPAVREAAVVGVPDPRWQERPLAVVVPRPGAEVTIEDLRDFLGGRIPRWQVPERWVLLDAIPKTGVGKFDKRAIRERYAAGGFDTQVVGPLS